MRIGLRFNVARDLGGPWADLMALMASFGMCCLHWSREKSAGRSQVGMKADAKASQSLVKIWVKVVRNTSFGCSKTILHGCLGS